MSIKLAQFKEHLSHFEKVIIGHRGAAALAPENTLGSFQIACKLGCPLIELDVHQVRDESNTNELIVIHDDTLDRTTNQKGEVSQISLPDIPQILTKDGASIPLLSEVISLIESEMKTLNTAIGLNIELKGDNTGLLTADYMKTIDAIPTIVSSFKLKELRAFRATDKDTPVAPLFHTWEDSCTEIGEELNAVAINCSAKIVNENRVKLIKERGFTVFVYTVNSPSKAEELFNMGVDGIFTDHPDKMKNWLSDDQPQKNPKNAS